ncbi:MAG: hypothetical protein M3Y64_02030, partial [Gemmatimonadota bacterium]|nr:hypothetical protein [Gemmatimonadota bacterium]
MLAGMGPAVARYRRLIFLLGALLLIFVATLAPGSTSGGAALPRFWCVACDPLSGADIVVNTLLFIPLGAALAMRNNLWRTVFAGALV